MITIVSLFYGLACCATLCFAWHSQSWRRLAVAAVLASSWFLCTYTWLAGCAWLWPAIDLLAGLVTLRIGAPRRPAWLLCVVYLFCAQETLHTGYWAFYAVGDDSYLLRYTYRSALNALFVVQLLLVSKRGLERVASSLLHRLLGRPVGRGMADTD